MRAADLRDPGHLVTGLIDRELVREQLLPDTFGRPDPASIILAKSADRSVLGCMNDMAFMCEVSATRSGYRMTGRWQEENCFRYGCPHFDLDSLDSCAVTPDNPAAQCRTQRRKPRQPP